MKRFRIAGILAAIALMFAAIPANASQGGGHDRWGFIDCWSPSQVVVHGYFVGDVRMAVKDPINGQNYWHPFYKWSRFVSSATPNGYHLEWHVADRDGLDGAAWIGHAYAECVTFA